ncbi:MAG: hypothetical protein KC897_00305 [Candidatus Omnitrophica bacterium]|nr:hypothetical protein [Candidatus Omnitrophota bacterium]MCB9721983.1 hypothetical protein [Candidatus Omnitrophota bacterium]
MQRVRFITLIVLTALAAMWPAPAAAQPVARVLFIGNEYTDANDLPEMLEQLAAGTGDALMTGKSTMPGFRLMQHFQLDKTKLLLRRQQWDYVILQEHGILPLDERMRENSMIPAVQRFRKIVSDRGATPVLFVTWASRQGARKTPYGDFNSMQKALTDSYRKAAEHSEIMIAPVGEAMRRALNNDKGIVLFFSDGQTPTLAGTYLAACVIYATLYQRSPFGSSYTAGLKPEQARFLQDLAGEMIHKERNRWNIPPPRKDSAP